MKRLRVLGTLAVCLSVCFSGKANADGGALVFRLGAYSPDGSGSLWERSLESFDFELEDFTYITGGVELNLHLMGRLEVSAGVDAYSRQVSSSYRDFVSEEGASINQSFKLRVLPITGGLRLLPLGKQHRWIPHVAAGAGLYRYTYETSGGLVDRSTQEVSFASFDESGFAPGLYVGAGLEFCFQEGVDPGQGWYGFVQFRRHWATPTLNGHELIDRAPGELSIGGNEVSLGVSLRF